MDSTRLLSALLGGVLSARPKAHRNVARLFGGSSSLWSPRTLLSVGALGWAAYEIVRSRSGSASTAGTTVVPGTVMSGPGVVPGTVVVPSVPPPPLPKTSSESATTAATPSGAGIQPVRRLVGVLLAAARANGEISEAEYGRLLAHAREAGGETIVGEELRAPTPITILAGGIPEPRAREDLYRLAFGIVRCDESVNAREREWLEDLARALQLERSGVIELESAVVRDIARS